ncbi:MAG: NAD(P)H-dependent FMN reductase [Candidatus Promineifilaceae bacterium]
MTYTTNQPNIHILAFAGSLRKNSYNRGLIRAAQEVASEGVTIEIFDLDDIPLFNADVEAQGTPEAIMAFRERLKAADALLIATPEYNYSIPGVLKNALDWASRVGDDAHAPIDGKVAAIMGAAGMLGSIRAQMHLREILIHNDIFVLNKPAVMVSRAWEYFEDGQLTDPALRGRIQKLLAALRDWTIRLYPEKVMAAQPGNGVAAN